MKQLLLHTFRRAGFIVGVSTVTALGFGLITPANAARLAPVISVSFDPAQGILTVTGDDQDNAITIGRNAVGTILVNGLSPSLPDGRSTIANTRLIRVFGQGGHDTIRIDEAKGALPKTNLFGGIGNDTLVGGAGEDQIFGQAGNDKLLGQAGIDFLFGGPDSDVLTGGDGNDQSFGESGDDRLVSNPGDDTDLNEGGAGTDIVEVNGGGDAETFTVTANGARVRFDQLRPTAFALDIGTAEKLVLKAGDGGDTFSATGNLAALIQITVDGGAGNDTLLGSNGADVLHGGEGNDTIDGNQSNDRVLLGIGNDTFQWDPGDGNDTVEGQAGTDTLRFNGSAGAETFDASANAGRVRFSRNLASIVMDLNDVESIDLNALGGVDTIIVNNIRGTDLTKVNLNLAAAAGGGDGQIDNVIVNATNGDDAIVATGDWNGTTVRGLAATVNITGVEMDNDGLTVGTFGGDDTVNASKLTDGAIMLTAYGGDNDDTLIGGDNADVLSGDDGDDVLRGGPGVDVLDGGAGTNSVTQD